MRDPGEQLGAPVAGDGPYPAPTRRRRQPSARSVRDSCSSSCARDPTILRFEAPNAAFELVVGAREVLPVVALHQVRTQVSEDLQEVRQTFLLQLTEAGVGHLLGHLLPPGIQTLPHRGIGDDLVGLGPTPI